VRQVGYIPELYEDAQSEKYKISRGKYNIEIQLRTVAGSNEIYMEVTEDRV